MNIYINICVVAVTYLELHYVVLLFNYSYQVSTIYY
jgi:hypothetical protein